MIDCPNCAQLRADAGTVVHALTAATILIEGLIDLAPEGEPFPQSLVVAYEGYRAAMAGLRQPAAPPEDGTIALLKGKNAELVATLQPGLTLIDAVLTELRRALNGPPPIHIIVARNNFDAAMKKVLAE